MVSTLLFGAALLSPLPAGQAPDVLDVVFSEIERRLICDHYGVECRAPRPDDRGEREDDGDSGGHGKGKAKSKGARGRGASGLPPGLAKRDSLPPGLQRQLDEKGRLPPGLQKRALPDDLRRRLPARGPETEVVIVDRDVLLIQAATGFVYDVIADIVRD